MNCGAVIDNNHSGGARKKEVTMIIKVDWIEAKQLAELVAFIDGPENKLSIKDQDSRGTKYSTMLIIRLIKTEGASVFHAHGRDEKNEALSVINVYSESYTLVTHFNITLEINPKAPREKINKAWEILNCFPESNKSKVGKKED